MRARVDWPRWAVLACLLWMCLVLPVVACAVGWLAS